MTESAQGWGSEARALDQRVRSAAFSFLGEQTRLHGDVLPRNVLAEGFLLDGERVPLLGPQGIFKPRLIPELPLSITTVPVVEGRDRPYADELSPDNLLTYRYRGTDPNHRDNAALRLAMVRQAPLIYFYGLVPGEYVAVWPVYIVGDDPARLSFTVAVDSHDILTQRIAEVSSTDQGRRQYVTQLTLRRLHQEGFRLRVLKAYRDRCAVCRLRHHELLDAAHILPDGHPKGAPILPNGLALCKLHHAAFDRYILGVRPDLVIEVRRDVLDESDGPMLRHGLQGFHGGRIHVPRPAEQRPSESFLAERFELFQKAG
jgi:putative restriction endonuclease